MDKTQTPNPAPPELSMLSNQQKSVIDAFRLGKNLFITGGAGSGKSYLLNFLKRSYSHLGLEVTASTGVAAVNIGGSTIHSWSGIGLANLPVDRIVENIFSGKMSRVRRRIRSVKTLAIDEISMISADVFEILDQVFRSVRQNDAPMGGVQMLLFGDFLQLPPVNRMSQNSIFCFESEAWKKLDPQVFILEETFRQSDKKFIKVLNNIRFGKLDEDDKKALESRVGLVDNNSAIRPTILTTHNFKVEKINEEELKKIPNKELVYEAKYFGTPEKIDLLRKNCIACDALKLKVGAQVMMIKNSYQKDGIVNGSLGIVRDFSPKKFYPIVEFSNGKILTVAPEEWLIERYDEERKMIFAEAGVTQVPLIMAWAITIHKSQGLTLDKIFCDLSDVFSPGQAYVALSRARSLSGVFIDSINFKRIVSDGRAVDFYRTLSNVGLNYNQ